MSPAAICGYQLALPSGAAMRRRLGVAALYEHDVIVGQQPIGQVVPPLIGWRSPAY